MTKAAMGLLPKAKKCCAICGKDRDGVQLLTITPQLWRKPKGVKIDRNKCIRMTRGVTICDDCFALGVIHDNHPELWQMLRERLIAGYNYLREASL